MRTRSVARRLERLVDRGHAGDRERLIRQVATETGLHPAEVRAELGAIGEHTRRFGPSTIEQVIRRCAEELGLTEGEVWAAYASVSGTAGVGR